MLWSRSADDTAVQYKVQAFAYLKAVSRGYFLRLMDGTTSDTSHIGTCANTLRCAVIDQLGSILWKNFSTRVLIS